MTIRGHRDVSAVSIGSGAQTAAGGRERILRRRVRFVAVFTIAWNLVEAVVAILAATSSASVALLAFGLDSIIEVGSAAALAWQFTRKDPEKWERPTVKVIGFAFVALALYVATSSIVTLVGGAAVESSVVGIALTSLSLVVMPVLAIVAFRTGRELESRSVLADAEQLALCVFLSAAVLLGLVLAAIPGWQWADLLAAALIAAAALREGVELLIGRPRRRSNALKHLARSRDTGAPR